jgi:hypothetical protein
MIHHYTQSELAVASCACAATDPGTTSKCCLNLRPATSGRRVLLIAKAIMIKKYWTNRWQKKNYFGYNSKRLLLR